MPQSQYAFDSYIHELYKTGMHQKQHTFSVIYLTELDVIQNVNHLFIFLDAKIRNVVEEQQFSFAI